MRRVYPAKRFWGAGDFACWTWGSANLKEYADPFSVLKSATAHFSPGGELSSLFALFLRKFAAVRGGFLRISLVKEQKYTVLSQVCTNPGDIHRFLTVMHLRPQIEQA
jgi:hypothetical protein